MFGAVMNSEDQIKYKVADYPFEKCDFWHYLKIFYKDRGLKVLYQFLNRPHRRSFSRGLIKKFAPTGFGLEIGVGARTICPTDRTILSDAFSAHGVHDSIDKIFFKGSVIPYDDNSFSFVLSEHVLEHIANPLKTLEDCIRVLVPGGKLFLFLPHRDRTNDSHRQLTTLEHVIKDYKMNVAFDDDTHVEDWFKNVVKKGLMPIHYSHLSKRDLLKTRSIHQHVWTEKQVVEMLEYLNLKICYVSARVKDRRDSFVVIAEKRA